MWESRQQVWGVWVRSWKWNDEVGYLNVGHALNFNTEATLEAQRIRWHRLKGNIFLTKPIAYWCCLPSQIETQCQLSAETDNGRREEINHKPNQNSYEHKPSDRKRRVKTIISHTSLMFSISWLPSRSKVQTLPKFIHSFIPGRFIHSFIHSFCGLFSVEGRHATQHSLPVISSSIHCDTTGGAVT